MEMGRIIALFLSEKPSVVKYISIVFEGYTQFFYKKKVYKKMRLKFSKS